jgi:hypothetical protein
MNSDQAIAVLGGIGLLAAAGFLLEKILVRWFADRSWEQSLKALKAGRQPFGTSRRTARFQVCFDSVGLSVSDIRSKGQETLRMRWDEVIEAKAFKRDLLAVDCICLFLSGADGMGIELDEEMEGWTSLCEALPQRLPGCLPFHEWLWNVATPAFETNLRTIFARNPVTLATSTSRRS